MKLRKIVYFGLLLFVLIASKGAFAQTTYTVTDPSLGNAGSLDVILEQAMVNANLGEDVTVLFNAPTLCQIDEVLPMIVITSGSLTLKKDPLATTPQGIQLANPNNLSLAYGFYIQNTGSSSVLIDGLSITGFVINQPTQETSCILVSESSKLTIQNCSFQNSWCSIKFDNRASDLLIQNNNIVNNILGMNYSYSIDFEGLYVYNHGHAKIYNNTIESIIVTTTYILSTGTGIRCSKRNIQQSNFQLDYELEIENNQISKTTSILVDNEYGHSNFIEDNLFVLKIVNNSLSSLKYNLNLVNPLKAYTIQSNTFSGRSDLNNFDNLNITHVRITSNAAEGNPYGLDFIGPNTFIPTQVNGQNVFNKNWYYSFHTVGYFGKGINIIGQDLKSSVKIVGGAYTNIRETKIECSDYFENLTNRFHPIILYNAASILSADPPYGYDLDVDFGNKFINHPTNLHYELEGNVLTLNYDLVGEQITQSNAKFIVEFFHTNNMGGSLLEYLASDTIETLSQNGHYTRTITLPTGFQFTGIAATVTAKGTQNTPNTPIGTSMVQIGFTGDTYDCKNLAFCIPDAVCVGEEVTVINNSSDCVYGTPFVWNYGDGSPDTEETTHVYSVPGNYVVKLIIPSSEGANGQVVTNNITVSSCTVPCFDCIGSFAPLPGEKYVLSGWVKEDGALPTKTSYTFPSIEVLAIGDEMVVNGYSFSPKGQIIDGWQRIEEEFEIPAGATNIEIKLVSSSGICYFDDIRVFPFDGTMKSYVYDPVTLRLVSELDEHNYATFYEYDEEGKLIRVKKETERGVMTIKENKNSSVKREVSE